MHRDVKLQNILLKDNYRKLVLTDYGTATNLGRSLLTNDVGTPGMFIEGKLNEDFIEYLQ